MFSNFLNKRGIKLIDDLLDDSGNVLGYAAFVEKYPFAKVNRLVYMGWCEAILMKWKRILRNSQALTNLERESEPEVKVNGKKVLLSSIRTSYFYDLMLLNVEPTAQRRWKGKTLILETCGVRCIQCLFKVTTSTKLQSLHFKIVHRFFPMRTYLSIRKVVEDPFCDNCGEIEPLEHCFFQCEEVAIFWRNLNRALNSKLPCRKRVILTSKEVIFGGLNGPDIVNLIILVAKQLIF